MDANFLPHLFQQNQVTIFDRLNEKNKSWRVYYYDFPISLVLTHQRNYCNLTNYHVIDQFFRDAVGPEESFPAFTLIEPKYLGTDQNDDHPPHNIMKAQKLIADVYNALRSNPDLWKSTLLVVNYDEHGGFYDHVNPPPAAPPDEHTTEFSFDRLGVRVPALIISPWAKQGVVKTIFDHTSLLKYLIDKWELRPLGERAAHANSIADALDFEQEPRLDSLPFIRVSNKVLISENIEKEKRNYKTDNKESIHFFADYLNKQSPDGQKPPQISPVESFKASIGRALVQFGMWLQEDSDEKQQARIARTCDIVDKTIHQSRNRGNTC